MNAADDHVGEGELLRHEPLLEAALHDTASMLVRTDLVTVGHASSEDELRVLGESLRACNVSLFWLVRCLESQEEFLDCMVAIRVRRKVEDVL